MSYINEQKTSLGRLATQMSEIVNKAKADGNRGLTSAEREAFHALEADYTSVEDSIKMAEKSDSLASKLAEVNNSAKISETMIEQARDEAPRGKKSVRDLAFGKYLRNGMSALEPEERKGLVFNTMSTGTGSQGGYVVPTGFSNQLEEAKKWFGGITGTVERFETETGQPLPWPTMNDTGNVGVIIGQNAQVTEQDLVFNQVTFGSYIGSSKLVLVPLALIQDSFFDLDALVARMLGTRLGRLMNVKCTVGTGSGEPTGIVTAAVAAGSVVTFPTGSSTSITYNSLVDIEHAVDPSYRNNPATKWMFSDTMLKAIKKLVDSTNRPLWQPGLASSFREGAGVDTMKPLILDHEYVINNDMAAPAADAYSVLFGDMSTFKVREVKDTTVIRLDERYADYLQVGYTAFNRFDSNLVDAGTHPIAVGQQSHT